MKKVLIAILTIIVAVGCVFMFAGCNKMNDHTPEGIQKYGKLVVATNAFFPPFEYLDSNNNIVGWDMEIAAELAKKLGVELVIENMEFDAVLLAPGANKAHIAMAGISYSEKRDETLDFSEGVFNSSQVIIVKEGSDIKGPNDLGGKKVGVQSGTVGQLLAEMDPDWAYDENDNPLLAEPDSVSPFSTGAEAVLALTQDKVDAVIIDKYPAEKFVENNPGTKILGTTVFDDEYAFAVKEGNKELVAWINQALHEMKIDGTMDKINKKYFG